MKIKKLEIRNFGKLHKKTLEFSEGINLIVGENESGKSTVHTFIRSMLFGLTRGRGRAAKNDSYSRYEPWENPAYYAGNMIFESGGKTFSLTRNFYRSDPKAQLICLEDESENGGRPCRRAVKLYGELSGQQRWGTGFVSGAGTSESEEEGTGAAEKRDSGGTGAKEAGTVQPSAFPGRGR